MFVETLFKKMLPLWFSVLCLYSPIILYAKDLTQSSELCSKRAHEEKSAIHTYGGGESLGAVFRAISMVIYGNAPSGLGKSFRGFLQIVITIGGFAAIILALSKESFLPLVRVWFLPTIFITSILLIPRKTIYIQDHLIPKSADSRYSAFIKVDDVPFFLAEFASLASTISYKFTGALEDVTHKANDSIYNWTGHIYAGETLFQAGKVKINNSLVEENFRSYCRECVYRDIGIGIYTKNELKSAPNLLTFLEERTSRIRSVRFRLDDGQVEWIPCYDSIKRIKKKFDCAQLGGPLRYLKRAETGNAPEILFGEIGNEAEFLLSQSAQGSNQMKELMKQQIAIDFLQEEIPGTLGSFAAKRAEQLAQSNEKILGAKGVRSVVKMHNFFEGAIYIVFPLVLIFALIPSWGIKVLTNWIQFVLWVNIWPPFYVAINFFLSGDWRANVIKKFGTNSVGLTLFTSSGLADLYSSMESTAAVALFFTPFISWAMMKGGVGSMVHLASSLSAPDQSSAAVAAQEQTSGNYTFGQTSFDNKSLYNDSRFKRDLSPQLKHGALSLSEGFTDLSYAPEGGKFMMKQGRSQFRELDLNQSQAFSNTLQQQMQNSENLTHEKSIHLSNSASKTASNALGLVNSLSEGGQLGNNLSHQDGASWQRLTSNTQSQLNDYCNTWGVDRREALEEAVRAGCGLPIVGSVGGSGSSSVGRLSNDQFAKRATNAENISKSLQEIAQYSTTDLVSDTASKDARSHIDFTQSWNETCTTLDQYRSAETQQKAWSDVVSGVSSKQFTLGENLNDRYLTFLMDKHYDDPQKVQQMLNDPTSIESFVQKGLDPVDLLKTSMAAQTRVPKPDFQGEYREHYSKIQQEEPFHEVQKEVQESKLLNREEIESAFDQFKQKFDQKKTQFTIDKEAHVSMGRAAIEQGVSSQILPVNKEETKHAAMVKPLLAHAKEHLNLCKIASSIFPNTQHFKDLDDLNLSEKQKMDIIDERISTLFP